MSSLNIVYVLTNPAIPGLVIIGYTTQNDANIRFAQLYTTGVPVPFELVHACKVKNAEEVEKALHIAFSPQRINPKREFFKIESSQAIAILKLLHTEDATQEIENQPTNLDKESIIAAEQLKSKRPNMNFIEMGIPIGSELHFINGTHAITVCAPKKVIFKDEQLLSLLGEISLTSATRQMLGIEYSVQPSPYWTYQGKLLKEIYEETYDFVES